MPDDATVKRPRLADAVVESDVFPLKDHRPSFSIYADAEYGCKVIALDCDAEGKPDAVERTGCENLLRKLGEKKGADGQTLSIFACPDDIETLESYVRTGISNRSPMGDREAVEIIVTLARAAQRLHEHGMYAAILRPTAVFIDDRGNPYILACGNSLLRVAHDDEETTQLDWRLDLEKLLQLLRWMLRREGRVTLRNARLDKIVMCAEASRYQTLQKFIDELEKWKRGTKPKLIRAGVATVILLMLGAIAFQATTIRLQHAQIAENKAINNRIRPAAERMIASLQDDLNKEEGSSGFNVASFMMIYRDLMPPDDYWQAKEELAGSMVTLASYLESVHGGPCLESSLLLYHAAYLHIVSSDGVHKPKSYATKALSWFTRVLPDEPMTVNVRAIALSAMVRSRVTSKDILQKQVNELRAIEPLVVDNSIKDVVKKSLEMAGFDTTEDTTAEPQAEPVKGAKHRSFR